MPNRLSGFWQELKRRNVIRVLIVYAGTAFVIIELVNNITEPLRLPEWTPTLIIILLLIGFPLAVLFSWLFEVGPDGGLMKTEPAYGVSERETSGSSAGWKIASYISFVVILGLIVLNVVTGSGRVGGKMSINKSIAVLPFTNESQDQENEYLINGIMEDLMIKLQTIKDLRVPGRASTEQYRKNLKPIPEIASEMKVGYIVLGSGQRYGDKIRLRVELVEGTSDRHIWANSYDEVINGPDDVFRIQSEIAQLIAVELQAAITPEEKELIEKVPTSSITALDLYQRGNEEYWSYRSEEGHTDALRRAEYFFREALKYDSTFAQAYTGLARIYWGSEGYLSENYLDTVRVLLDRALSCDPTLSDAHTLYGHYYFVRNDINRAMREVRKAISLNPNDWEAYSIKSIIDTDYINQISDIQTAVMLNRGPELPSLLGNLAANYMFIGFFDKAKDIYVEVLKLTGDSARYFKNLGYMGIIKEDFTGAIEFYHRAFDLDSTDRNVDYYLFATYMALDDFENALKYGDRCVEWMKVNGRQNTFLMHRVGYYYWLKGLKEEADYYFSLEKEYALIEIELERPRSETNMNTYYDLAATYAITENVEKAIECLRNYLKRTMMDTGTRMMLKYDPLLDPIRNNQEFLQILSEVDSRYHAEHERVRQWLEENDML